MDFIICITFQVHCRIGMSITYVIISPTLQETSTSIPTWTSSNQGQQYWWAPDTYIALVNKPMNDWQYPILWRYLNNRFKKISFHTLYLTNISTHNPINTIYLADILFSNTFASKTIHGVKKVLIPDVPIIRCTAVCDKGR